MRGPAARRFRILAAGCLGALLCVPVLSLMAAGPPVGSEPVARVDYGLSTAKRANCLGCHKWHGDGGPGYGGAAISLRATQLSRDELITVIRCGRPGTNMPYFDRKAYTDDRCYGMTFGDFSDADGNRPLQGKKYLNDRQVQAVADFVIAELQGKEITRAYCEKFFSGPTKQCEQIPAP